MLDRQVLLDPLEEGLDLPTLAIDFCDGEGRQVEAIGEEDEELVRFGVAKRNTAQAVWIGEFRFWSGEQDALIAAQSRRWVDRTRGGPSVARIVLGANDERDLALMQRLQSGEIEIAAIDDDDRTGWPVNQVEHINVVHLACRDMDENGNGAAQVDDGVGFDGGFGRAEVRPGEQCQAQIDGGGVQRIERFLETPLRQTSCRSDMMLILGAIRTNDGSVWRSIQKQSSGAVVAAGERQYWRSSL